MLTEADIKNALKAVKYPGYSRDIVSFGLIKDLAVGNGAVSVVMQLTTSQPEIAQQIKTESESVLRAIPGVNAVHVEVRLQAAAPLAKGPAANQNKLPGLRHVVAVASGKGGVGKSTMSANLACGLAHLGMRV